MLMLLSIASLLAQNDCTDAITVCGNTGYAGLSATGPGNIQEITLNNNDCEGFENNSIWLRLPINTGGTLGFIITPTNAAIEVDFDFYLYGPNATCNNLGHTIRCSTTNPEMAGSDQNITGMIETEIETAEGPGLNGNNFVNWITVNSGEEYLLMIDRYMGSSDFSIQWVGTATFNEAPVFNNPQSISLTISQCDDDTVDDKTSSFNIAVHEAMLIGNQADVTLTYHESINDAIVGINPILNTGTYNNTAIQQTLYMRMQRNATECFEVMEFIIEVINPVVAGEPASLSLCDTYETGSREFNLTQNDALIKNGNTTAEVKYYASLPNAEQEFDPLPGLYLTGNATIWARLENTQGCYGHDITSFDVTVIPLPDIKYTLDIKDFTTSDNSISINMPDAQDYEFSLNGGVFSDKTVFTDLKPGIYTISIKAKTGCKTISEEVVILNYPRFFTPNGDGANDVWRIPYLTFEKNATVTIFDRYGKVLTGFKGSGSWDGTLDNQKLPATDYWFVMQLDTGRIIKGHFAMVR